MRPFHFSRHLMLFQNINVPFTKLLLWNFDSILCVLENRSKLKFIFRQLHIFFLLTLADFFPNLAVYDVQFVSIDSIVRKCKEL